MDKIYTQEDMDNISKKIKESQKTKYEKTHIGIETYKELENKFNDLTLINKKESFKDTFKTNGGNMETYEDFISLHKDVLNLEGKELSNKLVEIKESKKYFFNESNTKTPNTNATPKDKDVLNDLFNGNNSDLVEGTMYKK